MKKLLLFSVVVSIIFLFSCRKERNAEFTVEKSNLYLGEKAVVTPLYKNVDNYQWNFGDDPQDIKEEKPEPYLYKKEGNYTITLTASHKRNFRKAVTHTNKVIVTSWSIDSIRINSIPDFNSWDSNSGPDIKIKITDTTLQFQNVFVADFVAYFPYNISETQLPITLKDLNFKLYYGSWEFRLLEDEFPLPNQSMNSWFFNPYLKGSNGNFKLDGDGYSIDIFYRINV